MQRNHRKNQKTPQQTLISMVESGFQRQPHGNQPPNPQNRQQRGRGHQSQAQGMRSCGEIYQELVWEQRFKTKAQGKTAEIWHQEGESKGPRIHAGLSKAQSSIATQL